ncbi:unnamed protein product [Prorocentrum cordatum]|uniref:Ferredoxin thioredoxin reductase alpha chain domain-containing protein n=1 Tax=Prorocentrum cordatum TaxID=2364126 RepID=A0ABN9UVK5_9DINO|nr:unnamed protein product [Polarella glacialis]
MSLGAAVRASVRPWKGAVKTSKFVAEPPVQFKPLANGTTLVVAKPAAVAAHAHDDHAPKIFAGIIMHHPPPKSVPLVDVGEIKLAFKTWESFYIFPPGLIPMVGEMMKAAVTSKLPGGGH